MLGQNRTIVFAGLIALSLCVSSWGQGVRLADGAAHKVTSRPTARATPRWYGWLSRATSRCKVPKLVRQFKARRWPFSNQP